MKKRILFSESQRFRQWWLYITLIICLMPVIFVAVKTYQEVPEYPQDMFIAICIGIGVFLLTLAFIFMIRLDTEVSEDGVFVRFYPIHIKYKQFRWTDLDQAYVRTYAPMAEYGGWGLRISMGGYGKAYNVSGNKGLQLVTKAGKKLLIGTVKAGEMEQVLKNINAARHATSNVTSPGS
jgi:hypothetical protein